MSDKVYYVLHRCLFTYIEGKAYQWEAHSASWKSAPFTISMYLEPLSREEAIRELEGCYWNCDINTPFDLYS